MAVIYDRIQFEDWSEQGFFSRAWETVRGWKLETVIDLLFEGVAVWYVWVFLSVPIFHFVKWVLARGRGWRLSTLFAVHLLAGMMFISAYLMLSSVCYVAYDIAASAVRNAGSTEVVEGPAENFAAAWWNYIGVFFGQLIYFFAVYLGIVAACYAFLYYRPALKASQLESRLTRAKLEALKMQLHPHFLFNALNSISVLVHRDPDMADRM
ncbi:MAG: histidine kinase, partial [Planctomycetes bacterium]|nr:histidine kinase [Planctomycetota bacterium]